MSEHNKLIMEMTAYYHGDAKRIQHFMKVYSFAKMIGQMENLPEKEQKILEVAGIVHDIGIKVSEEKYGNSNGKHQEEEGPGIAIELLQRLGYEQDVIERVAYLVGHHHTYTNIEGIDYQILVEADFLVNIYEDDMSTEAAKTAYDKMFHTVSGKYLCKEMYAL